MKYTLDLLPLRAFQGRGTPVGGRGLKLYGGGGDYFDPNAYAAANPDWIANNSWFLEANGIAAPAQEAAPAPAEPAPVAQTVEALYQEVLGRAPDEGGAAAWGGALAAGKSAEQMKAEMMQSPEFQARQANVTAGRPADAPAPAPAAAQPAQWEFQPAEAGDYGILPGYWRDVISGDRKEAAPIEGPRSDVIDPNTLQQHLAPNYEGTPTQFYDTQGNLKGVLIDMVGSGGNGQYILDPMSLGLALKPGEKPSVNSAIQQRDENNQLLFIDPTTGGTTIYNTGVPAETGSTVKDRMYINDPGNRGSIIPADVYQGAALLAATMLTGGVGGSVGGGGGRGGG